MSSIYDITGERYFIPLASKNRKIYLDTILYLNKLLNELFESQENDKSKIIEALAYHLDDLVSIKMFSDDSDEEIEFNFDNIAKASYLINKLEDYGWLEEESIGNGRKALDFNSHSYSFISLIEELIENRKPQYTGYIRTINNVIYKFDYTKVDDLEILDKNLNEFVVSLRGLRSSIQRYYRNITKNKDSIILEELLDEFTGEYKEYFFDSAYLNLKIRDNVDAEIPKIEAQCEIIFNDYFNMEKLIAAKMNEKGFEDYNVARKAIKDSQKRILSNLKTIPSIIEIIDSKNDKYVARTVSVIIHMIKRGEDIEGILHRLIDYVKENDVDESYISIFEMKHYRFDYLYKPRKASIKPIPEMIKLDKEISNEIKEKTMSLIHEDKGYNIHYVNDFVFNFLVNRNERKISELEMKSKYELIMIILILIYSKLPNALYSLELLNDRINKDDISFNDFILKRKDGKIYD